jgi:drug/metabolite transporter (DMT)-like permease
MFVGGAVSALVLALVMSLPLFSSTPVTTDTAPNSVPWPPALDAAWLGYVVALAELFWLSNQALQLGATRLPPHITALHMLTEVVFASVSSVWLGAAEWSTRTWVGASLIVVASVWAAGGTRSTTEV